MINIVEVEAGVNKIAAIKRQVYTGHIVDLHPYDSKYTEEIIRIRNQGKAKYFLSQEHDISREQQLAWMQRYFTRFDEVGFVVMSKRGDVIGTMFLYNYQNSSMELGRVAFNLNKTIAAPYALECALLILDIAFDWIQVSEVAATIKKDNYPLLRFVQKLGFKMQGDCTIRNNAYSRLRICSENKSYQQYNSYISAWAEKYHLS